MTHEVRGKRKLSGKFFDRFISKSTDRCFTTGAISKGVITAVDLLARLSQTSSLA